MPKLYSIGSYSIFFWSNENNEPVHIHIAKKQHKANSTKVWLTKNGGYVLANNKSKIVRHDLNGILDALSIHHSSICEKWKSYFDVENIEFYC